MTIPERFQKIMESEHLSPAQFADEIGVQRSSLSHILSGRNNPGYDYLVKILKRFDNLDANWLLTGSGEMYKSSTQKHSHTQNQLFNMEEQKSESKPLPVQKTTETIPENITESHLQETLQVREDKRYDNQQLIVKIIEYYSDDTFAVFYPKK